MARQPSDNGIFEDGVLGVPKELSGSRDGGMTRRADLSPELRTSVPEVGPFVRGAAFPVGFCPKLQRKWRRVFMAP